MNRLLLGTLLLVLSVPLSATHYYSRQNGNWSDASTWSTTPLGLPIASSAPAATDDVTISHLVDLKLSSHYVHFGDITVLLTGELAIARISGTAKKFTMAGSRMDVMGSLTTDADFLVGRKGTTDAGTVVFHSLSLIQIGDDLILNAYTRTIIDSNDCTQAGTLDDIYFVGPNTLLCGTGKFIVPDDLRVWDASGNEILGAERLPTIALQMCTGFDLFESEGNCELNIPIVSGMGSFVLDLDQARADQASTPLPSQVKIATRHPEEGPNAITITGLTPFSPIYARLVYLSGAILSSKHLYADREGRLSLAWPGNAAVPELLVVQLIRYGQPAISRKIHSY